MMSTGTAILEHIVEPKEGGFSPEHARHVLSLSFPDADLQRYLYLSKKAQDEMLSEVEGDELDDYLRANALLMILQSKARVSLKQHGLA